MSHDEPLDVVVAVFDAGKRVRKDDKLHERLATDLETATENAVVVAKDAGGHLTMTGADHSIGRNLAVLTGKLMIVLPLGFHGILAVTNAATKIAAAGRDRPETPDVTVSDIGTVTEQIPPGGVALIVSVPHKALQKTEKRAQKLGAVGVWHATETEVLAALEQAGVEPVQD